jgi:hypothetical protein
VYEVSPDFFRIRSSFSIKALAATFALLPLLASAAPAAEVPDFMKIVSVNEGAPTPKGKIAFDNIYALNEGMFPIYEHALAQFKSNFRARHNLIMALFSAKGGRFILYQAGKEPVEAPSPPVVYRLAKSVGHCAMVTFNLVAPYCKDASADLSWRGEMLAYRERIKTAMDSLGQVDPADLSAENRELLKDTLNQILTFMNNCLDKNTFTYADVEAYTHGIKPNLAKLIGVASSAQVGHWYKVMEDWKKMLGPTEWENTYALSNSIYVARQNNILFSILVQFMGTEKMNDKLLLLETTDFTAQPDDMLTAFIRIVSDRALGQAFYKNYRLMDYELLGGGGRTAIEAEAAKRGQKAILPPLVPYNSTAWPWKTDPSTGSGPSLLDDIH